MQLPAQIGKYEIVSLIGRGGMGVVYQARDNVLGRIVALKVMTSDLAVDPEVHVRFLREARSVAALQHPNIVVVHELGEHEGSPFIAMEFIDGEPLDRAIRSGVPLTLLEKTDIIVQVAKALQYAHDKGVIHRDVKPGNIMRLREHRLGLMYRDGLGVPKDENLASEWEEKTKANGFLDNGYMDARP